MKKEKFFIDGMTCSACSSGIERSLKRKNYIQHIQINLINKVASVEFDENQSSLEDIFKMIEKLGYHPYMFKGREGDDQEAFMQSKQWYSIWEQILPIKVRVCVAFVLMLVLLYISMVGMLLPQLLPQVLHIFSVNAALQLGISVVIMLLGSHFYIKGFRGLWNQNPNMDSLIALSTIAAFVYSLFLMFIGSNHGFYFEGIAVIIALVMMGKYLEENAKKNANDAINALLSKQQREVIVLKEGQEEKVPIEKINIHDFLKILPGGSIPVDGVIVEGEAYIDESMLTGEPLPVFKQNSDQLIAGSLNTTTSFIMQAQTDAYENTLKAMIRLIEEAAQSKTKISRIADQVAAIFVPCVILIALLAGVFWTFQESIGLGLEVFIAVLVISCPCALGLATPMAIMIGGTIANKRGLFFKHAAVMERARSVSAVVFDKTGTLTHATLSVAEILSFHSQSEEELLKIAASIEQGSEHLIAQAILQEAKKRQLSLMTVEQCESVAGYGMKAKITGIAYQIGNAQWCGDERGILQEKIGFIPVFIKEADQVLGVILLEDQLKEEAKASIEAFHARGIKSYLLSGDDVGNVKRIAQMAGISDYIARAKPKDKLEFIQKLKAQGEVVMMVGDGVNDVAALEASDVSVSFSHASDVSYQSAEVIICNADIANTYAAVALGEAIVNNIKQNLFWAFCYNVISIPLACGLLYYQGILLNPMIAAMAMSLSSLSVVLNAQRLRKVKIKGIES